MHRSPGPPLGPVTPVALGSTVAVPGRPRAPSDGVVSAGGHIAASSKPAPAGLPASPAPLEPALVFAMQPPSRVDGVVSQSGDRARSGGQLRRASAPVVVVPGRAAPGVVGEVHVGGHVPPGPVSRTEFRMPPSGLVSGGEDVVRHKGAAVKPPLPASGVVSDGSGARY